MAGMCVLEIERSPYVLMNGKPPILEYDLKSRIRNKWAGLNKIEERIKILRTNYNKELEKRKNFIFHGFNV